MAACVIPGNSDLYGLGVRIGFYAQWTSTLLTTLFVREEEPIYRAVNILMQLAILICIFFMSSLRTIQGPEVLIALWLLAGALSSLTGDGFSASGTVAGEARLALYAALSAYGCWFWFGGLDQLPTSPCEDRVAVGFLGSTSLIDGWFRTVGKVASVCGLFVCVVLMGRGVVAFRNRHAGGKRTKIKNATSQIRPRTEVGLLGLSVLVIVFSIASIEYLIRDNKMVGVNDILAAGQLIPLLLGVFGLANSTASLFVDGRMFQPRCWLFFGRHLS